MSDLVPYPAPDGYGWMWVGMRSCTDATGWVLVYLGGKP